MIEKTQISSPQTQEVLVTPQKQTDNTQSKVCYKRKLRSYTKATKHRQERVSNLILYDSSKKNCSMFRVFLDDDIGFDLSLQNTLMPSDMDEDCSSSDEIINNGIKKGIAMLDEAVTKKKLN